MPTFGGTGPWVEKDDGTCGSVQVWFPQDKEYRPRRWTNSLCRLEDDQGREEFSSPDSWTTFEIETNRRPTPITHPGCPPRHIREMSSVRKSGDKGLPTPTPPVETVSLILTVQWTGRSQRHGSEHLPWVQFPSVSFLPVRKRRGE